MPPFWLVAMLCFSQAKINAISLFNLSPFTILLFQMNCLRTFECTDLLQLHVLVPRLLDNHKVYTYWCNGLVISTAASQQEGPVLKLWFGPGALLSVVCMFLFWIDFLWCPSSVPLLAHLLLEGLRRRIFTKHIRLHFKPDRSHG